MRIKYGSASIRLILRSGPKDRVSKDGAASCFETAAAPPPQHGAVEVLNQIAGCGYTLAGE